MGRCRLIYNSRNYSILLNQERRIRIRHLSTTVEIILYYLTTYSPYTLLASTTVEIILYYLTIPKGKNHGKIYNSRNYSILLNAQSMVDQIQSTTVEIILYYLTTHLPPREAISTTVEIILYYLT